MWKHRIFSRLGIANTLLKANRMIEPIKLFLSDAFAVSPTDGREAKKVKESKYRQSYGMIFELLLAFRAMRWTKHVLVTKQSASEMLSLIPEVDAAKFKLFSKLVKPPPVITFVFDHLSPICSPEDPLVVIINDLYKNYDGALEKIPDDANVRMIMEHFNGVPYRTRMPVSIYLDITADNPIRIVNDDFEAYADEISEKYKDLKKVAVL